MSVAPDWEEGNMRQLSAAVEWVRLRLERLAAEASPVAADGPAAGRSRWWRGGPGVPSAPAPGLGRAVAEAARRGEEAEIALGDQPSAVARLIEALGLTPFERDVVLLTVATELDTRVGALCARVQDDPTRAFPTFALALEAFDAPDWGALTPDRPLRALRLLEIHQPGPAPLLSAALRADERVVHYLKGWNRLDDRVAAVALPLRLSDEDVELPPSQRGPAEAVARCWRRSHAGGAAPATALAQVIGPDPESRRLVAECAARGTGRRLLRVTAEQLAALGHELDTFVRLWCRESRLLPLALLVESDEADADPAAARAAARVLSAVDGPAVLAAREPSARLAQPTVTVEADKPTTAEQRAAWRAAFGDDAAAARLAGQFRLNYPAIRGAVREAAAEGPGGPVELVARAWRRCKAATRPRAQGLAERLEPRATWDLLVLPDDVLRVLRQIADQARHRATVYEDWGFGRVTNRGLGLAALFSGPSGTGKTLSAEVLAGELDLDLYRVDLSRVVSKYIGETEKHLAALFDAFEDGGAILFFDECDALFGRRGEVRDGHDRYANLEVNYLLQRLESYRGLALLATNARGAMDPAFLRRLRFSVVFPMPGPAERRRLWMAAFPRGVAPVAALDYDRLGGLELTGGGIRAAALNAAFQAAAAGGPVTMGHILAAARDEYVKQDKLVRTAEFQWAGRGPGGAA
jgi:hypothetical protein